MTERQSHASLLATLTKQQRADLQELQVDLVAIAAELEVGHEPLACLTPYGRDIRCVKGGYIVQPRNDNYWIKVRSLKAAHDAVDHPQKYRAKVS